MGLGRVVSAGALSILAGCSLTSDLDGLDQNLGSDGGPCTPHDESCNGEDDDCDGAVDEGFGQLSCGQGACAVVIDACSNGKGATCTPWTGSPETCDGIDNDCNGKIDEGCACTDGATQECYSSAPDTAGVGACKKGLQTCSNGTWGGPCDGEIVPDVETCNAKDDDCDGSVDEGLQQLGYLDADQDGFGAGAATQICAGAAGTSDNDDDCYDANPDAHPGQAQFFTQDRGDGSFDYDCDGQELENLTLGPESELGNWGQPATNTASWYPMQKTAVFAVRFVPAEKSVLTVFHGAHQRISDATGTLSVSLRADAAGVPGALLETSTSSVDITTFATWQAAPTPWTVNFAGTHTLQAGTSYWLVARIASSNQGSESAGIIIPLIQNTYDEAFLSAGAGEAQIGVDSDGVTWYRNYRFPWSLDGKPVSGGGSFH